MRPPCHNCAKRHTACWTRCQLYAEWQQRKQKEAAWLKEEAEQDRAAAAAMEHKI